MLKNLHGKSPNVSRKQQGSLSTLWTLTLSPAVGKPLLSSLRAGKNHQECIPFVVKTQVLLSQTCVVCSSPAFVQDLEQTTKVI